MKLALTLIGLIFVLLLVFATSIGRILFIVAVVLTVRLWEVTVGSLRARPQRSEGRAARAERIEIVAVSA